VVTVVSHTAVYVWQTQQVNKSSLRPQYPCHYASWMKIKTFSKKITKYNVKYAKNTRNFNTEHLPPFDNGHATYIQVLFQGPSPLMTVQLPNWVSNTLVPVNDSLIWRVMHLHWHDEIISLPSRSVQLPLLWQMICSTVDLVCGNL